MFVHTGAAKAVKKATGYELEGVAKESDGFIHLINSGACCLDATGEAKDENGNGSHERMVECNRRRSESYHESYHLELQLTTDTSVAADTHPDFVTRAEMPATMIRLNLVKGLGPVLQIAEGWTVELPEEVSDTLWKTYRLHMAMHMVRTEMRQAKTVHSRAAYDVMNNWGANHGAITYGHIGADLITMCSMLRIPVCMHNVPEERYLPSGSMECIWNG